MPKVENVEKISSGGENDTDWCTYIDTDSVFYPAGPVVQRRDPTADLDDEDFMTEKILEVAEEMEDYINASYDLFSKHFLNADTEDHWLEIKQELIARRGFWIRKKRYAQWIIYDEGDPVQEPDWKGLDVVRSDFPTAFSDHMEEVLIDLLHDEPKEDIDQKILDFKDEIRELDLSEISNPTGVSKMDKYSTGEFGVRKKGTPIHVKASLAYNDLIDHLDIVSEKIKSGTKIRWVYLLDNPYGFTEIAYKGSDDPQEIIEYIHDYVDYDKMYEKSLKSKLEGIYDAMGWDFPKKKSEAMNSFFDL
jgi:DNA polymerase elongation subunit (family B)